MGISGDDIFFTSNNTSADDFKAAIDLNAIITIDDLTQVPVFIECLEGKPYETVAVRYNPGALKEGNFIIGSPLEAKYGMSTEQLIEAINLLKTANIHNFALHTMVASNELEGEYFAETAQILVGAAKQIEAEVGIEFVLLNLGGGFGIDYSRTAEPVDFVKIARSYKKASDDLRSAPLVTESGRFITGPHGYLVAKVRYVMHKYKDYIGLDASMQNLMRPGMYGAYHKISILGKEDDATAAYDVVGSLCENNDKFAIDRELPETVSPGDIAIINDVGAHGHAMGFNYNGLLRSAEVLLHEDGSSTLLRRAETVDDYLDTVIF
jgi:diaminopimelate decarboxylase